MKNSTSRRARNARSNVTLANTSTHTRRNPMHFNHILVALVPTAFTIALTACGVNPSDEALAAVTLNVTATAPDCAAEVAVKPDFCSNELKIKLVGYNETTESPNPAQMSSELTLEFDDAGEALGSIALPATGCFTLKVTGLSTGYSVKDGTGGFALNKVMCMSRAVNELDLVIDNSDAVPQGPFYGDACIKVANGTTAVDVTTCTVKLDGATVTGATPPAGVCEGGLFLNDITAKVYPVAVTCPEDLTGAIEFEVVKDEVTTVTVSVSSGTTPGTGTTDFCVRTVDENGDHVDETTCVISVNGNVVTPGDDPGNVCEGALLEDQPLTATISAVCGEAEGSIVASGPEDGQSDVSVTVTEPAPTDGTLCISVTDEDGLPVDNCVTDFLNLVSDPTTSANPPVTCTGVGKLWYKHVPAGQHDLKVTCGDMTGDGEALILVGEDQSVGVTVFPPQDLSQICTLKLGLTLDVDNLTVDMGPWLGYGTADSCVQMTPAQLSAMTVVDYAQYAGPGTCANSADPGCPIVINGLVVSLKNGFTGYADDEVRRFNVTVKDAANVEGHVYVVTKNGHTQ